MARRIVVRGGSGAVKTTLARLLARHLDVPHIELDGLHHGPNWASASAAEMRASVRAALDDERGWVVDGNYDEKLEDLVLERAELVLWLDLPLPTKLLRLLGRTAARWWREEELWNGNRENLKTAVWGADALFPWAVRSHFLHRQRWPERFRGRPVLRLRSGREVDDWLRAFTTREH
jgi:adenylate kinase family enzyme